MIANSAFLAAMVLMLIMFCVADELTFLVPYRGLILHQYLSIILAALAIVWANLFAAFYLASRGLFLKETGRKLAHIEKQIRSGDSISEELSRRLSE